MPIIHHLIADQFGTHLGKYQGRLKITQGGETLAQAPLLHLQSITIANSGVSISAEVIRACTEQGIPIHFLSGRGTPYASLYSSGLLGTVLTRRAQLTAYNSLLGVEVAAQFAAGKLENSASLLQYCAKYRKENDPDCFQELRYTITEIRSKVRDVEIWLQTCKYDNLRIEESRLELMSLEGQAAKLYWGALKRLIPADLLQWPGRVTRGATDPFNSALNYGYGMLYGVVEQALTLAGLDPYGGFVHADRPGKPSLVFDLIEEFRAVVVDRTLIGLVNKRVALEQDEAGRLTEKTRRLLAEKIRNRLDSPETYHHKQQLLRHIIQAQARHLAVYLRGETPLYQPFLVKW